MGDAKAIVVKPITGQEAARIVREEHYSGKVYCKSRLHLGVFYAGSLQGAMSFGPPLDTRKVLPLVRGTDWNGMLELNRMAFSDILPRNSESRALGVAFRVLRKHRPDIKWVLSFSDATRCGDGTIYRASGFVLTGVKRNSGLVMLPDGEVVTMVGLRTGAAIAKKYGYRNGIDTDAGWMARSGARVLDGFQFRYIKFLDPEWADRLTVPVIPFDKIPDEARMYLGQKGLRAGLQRATGDHPEEGGADPTPALHSREG